jgi:AcrR family transcriptional regulator
MPPSAKSKSQAATKETSNRYHHGDLKSSLIEAANVILVRDGADALSLRAIAAEVGVSHMAPYSHFKNKKELMHAVATAGFMQMSAAMEKVKASFDKPEELILEYGAACLEFATNNAQLYRLMLGQVETSGRKKTQSNSQKNTSKSTPPMSDLENFSKTPFILLKEAFAMRTSDKALARAQAMGAWSMVHGMSALIIEGHIEVPEGVSLKQFLAAAAFQTEKLTQH